MSEDERIDPKRAKERGQPFGLEWLEDDRPSLGDPAIVEGQVRGFVGAVVAVRADYNADKLSGPEAQKRVLDECQKYADLFMGKSKEFAPMGQWNTPAHLGQRLVNSGIEAAPETAAATFFKWHAAFVATIAADHEANRIDDEQAKFRIDVLIDDMIETLLGYPPDANPEIAAEQ
jgi:hypothetical protein